MHNAPSLGERVMRHLAKAVAAAAIAMAVAGGAARATSVRRMEIGEIGRRADVVLIGTVEGSRTRLSTAPGGKTRIFTDYEIVDVSTWKGSVETQNHVLSFAGGTLHGRSLGVEGMPVLEEGRRYLLFLGANEPLCPAVGWGQGIYRVDEDAGGRLLVRRADGEGGPAAPLAEFLDALDRAGVRGEGR